MTSRMSSSSDGMAERPSMSTRSRVGSSKRLAAIPKTRLSTSDDSSAPSMSSPSESPKDRDPSQQQESGDIARRRTRSSKSNGFLLDGGGSSRSSPRQSEFKRIPSVRNDATPGSLKGKARAIGRSPLGVDVMNNGDADNTASASPTRQLVPADQDIERSQERNVSSSTNQTQIINLALNLSESRRRHFSSNRVSSMDSTSFQQSPRTPLSPAPATPYSGSFSRKMNSPRARYSSESPGYGSSPQSPHSLQSQRNSEYDSDSPLRPFGLPAAESEDFYPSEATLLRVQKAKETLELSYQYHRLLQYLPKLPSDGQPMRSDSNRKASKTDSGSPVVGRAYNPLQYIRNRKVRRRENRQLNAEGQGWKHVETVKQWVDDVKEDQETQVSTRESSPLPPFPVIRNGNEPNFADRIPSTALDQPVSSKEGRPRVEWMVDPWNLLADAYWLDQDNHKALIEDARFQKIFPPPLPAPVDLRKEAIRSSTRRSMSIPRSFHDRNGSIVSDDGRHDSIGLERGRTAHIRQHSTSSNRDYSGSRDRKGPWRRLIGSQSTSGAEDDSGSGKRRPHSRRRSHMTAKERQDSKILEKQIADLLAKESHIVGYVHERGADEFDDQTYPGLSSRPSSPEADDRSRPLSMKTSQELASHLGLLERTREMQPRRFSVSQPQRDEENSGPQSPKIAINISPPRSRSRSARPVREIDTRNALSDGEEPSKLSPKSAHKSRRSFDGTREAKSQSSKVFDSRLRGLLKGTKIADIVSSPVTKVGDLIWKRDHGSDVMISPPDSTYDPSDVDDTLPEKSDQQDDKSLTRSNGHYYPAHLPTFTSPFRGRQRAKSHESGHMLTSPDGLDASFLQNRNRRSTSKLKLELGSTEPSPSPSATHSPQNDQKQTDKRSDVPASTQRRHAVTVMGDGMESAHPSNDREQNLWPEKDSLQYLNVTKRLLTPIHRTIQRKDIHILRALTQCALVSSNNVLQQRRKTPTEIEASEAGQGVHVSLRRQLQTSQNLVKDISTQNTDITSALYTLTETTFPHLSTSLLNIESYVSSNLTPAVRTAGDTADMLNAELATTRTLEVKNLNDELDLIARRRRRKLRWLRRGLYWGLEWTLLGLMWWAWLLVVCFRLIRGTVRAVGLTVRWLLWL